MLFFGANIAENIDISANGGRVRFFRDVANVTMDLNDVEHIDFRALGGADNIVVGDLSGTDVTRSTSTCAAPNGGGDGAADTVTVNGTRPTALTLSSSRATPAGSRSRACTPRSTSSSRSRRTTG